MQNELVPVFAGNIAGTSIQLVDARLLHGFLEVVTRFNDWIRTRIEEYGFVEDHDFLVTENRVTKRGRGGDRRSKDFHITLDMAKELAMVERTDKGREVRRYFIECERQLRDGKPQYALKDLRSKKALPGGLTLQQQDCVKELVKARVETLPAEKRGGAAITLWSALKSHFGCTYKAISPDLLTDALSLVARIDLEGETLPALPQPHKAPTYSAPLSLWHLSNRAGTRGWLTYKEMQRVEAHERPLAVLLSQIKADGHDVEGAQAEYKAIQLLLEVYYWRLATMTDVCLSLDRAGLNIPQH